MPQHSFRLGGLLIITDIKDLTKEQIEEAKACKTTEERINFFKEHNISLPDSYLEKISGGEGVSIGNCLKCSGYLYKTGSIRPGKYLGDLWPDEEYKCDKLGHVFWF